MGVFTVGRSGDSTTSRRAGPKVRQYPAAATPKPGSPPRTSGSGPPHSATAPQARGRTRQVRRFHRRTEHTITVRNIEQAIAKQQPGQFEKRQLIDAPLELDDRLKRNPVVTPTPGIELRVSAGTQADVGIAPHQPQQKPDLFLAAVGVAPLALDPVLGHLVTQPTAGAADDADVLRLQADFFEELTVHGLLRRLAVLDSALRKLPGMLSYPLAPENLVARIHQNDADVRPKALTVEHGATFNS